MDYLKDKDLKIYIMIALAVIVLIVGVGYAFFSTTLIISGRVTTRKSSWSIKFANLSDAILYNTQYGSQSGAIEVVKPEINGNDTVISNFEAIFTNPGDTISYQFDVVNSGTFNAEISSFKLPNPICTGTGNNATIDAKNVCNHLVYTLKYTDGTDVKVGDKLMAQENNTKRMVLTLTYKDDITTSEFPVNDVEISNLGFPIVYSSM